MGDIPFKDISVYTPEPGHRGIDIRHLDNTFIFNKIVSELKVY
jgi:hypothetical protein